jgi:hypothetical protein
LAATLALLMRLTKIHPAGAVTVALEGRTPIEAIITSPSIVPTGLAMASVPLVVVAAEAARKFTLPPNVAELAERNVGVAAWACAAIGASPPKASSARLIATPNPVRHRMSWYRTAFMVSPPA